MPGLNACTKSQAFIVMLRWVIIGLAPILCGSLWLGVNSSVFWGLGIYAGVTVLLTAAHVNKMYPHMTYWGLVHFIDLIAVSLMVLGSGGIHSESFDLYYLVILQAAMVFGVKQALGCLLASNLLYTGAVMLTSPSTEDIKTLGIRLVYTWIIGIAATYLAYSDKKHRRQAITDSVTSTYSRCYLDHSLKVEFNKASSKKTNLSIVMIDIDNFKAVNDIYGHQAGDMVLERVARTIKSTIREVDFVARYGGEEFIVTLPGIDSDKARDVAERIRNAVEKGPVTLAAEAKQIPVTVSCGVASYPRQAGSVEELIRNADKYLYEAKKAGRNRVYYKAG